MTGTEEAHQGSNDNDLSLLSSSHNSSPSRSDLAQSSDANDADEDTDMSVDGGVHIPLTSTNAQQLNVEMDMLDAELMGPYNIAAIAPNNGFNGDNYPTDDSLENFTTYAQEDDGFGTSYTPSLIMGEQLDNDDAILQPEHFIDPMSQVSQQLQNIQNVQALDGGHVVSTGPNGAIPANGTTYFTPLPPSPTPPAMISFKSISYTSEVISSGPDVVHPQMPSELSSYLSRLVPSTTYHGSDVNANPQQIMGLALHINIPDSYSDSSMIVIGNGSYLFEFDGFLLEGGITMMIDADIVQVEDQRNLTLQDFLYTWGASVTRGNTKKRRRGPNLVNVERLRLDKPTQILQRDLRGERCDFQGIDWTKLEVSRREAREKRNHSYRNYTNLRTPSWHVSTCQSFIIYKSSHQFYRISLSNDPRLIMLRAFTSFKGWISSLESGSLIFNYATY